MATDSPARWRPWPLRIRDAVTERLEPGEPIEALVPRVDSGPDPDSAPGRSLAVTSFLTLAGASWRHMTRKSTIVVTDRRVFIAQGLEPHEIGEYPLAAVRVLQYDTSGASLRVWLNVDGAQRGYRIWKGYRAATDAMVRALGDAPPSLMHTPDQ